MTDSITVLIADDHGVVREGLRAMLEREGLRVVGEARTGREAIALAESLSPKVVLLDIRMPDLDGLQALAAIKAARPETSVIMLTSHANPGYLARAVAHGAAGFLSKEVDPERIPAAVRAAAAGDHLLDAALLRAALASAATETPLTPEPETLATDRLTGSETRVLRLLAEGLDNEMIASALNLSVNTVKTHIRHIFEKLNVSDRTQAALWAVRHGVNR
ncbi:MAG: response regulator transcription factor [Chloroflexi bacterium]|nr:response regulator transcription factor [Chloroflexota bacterium]MBI5829414.1 response regulator transcription factor [Chloroflexota bacterium]